MIERVKGLKGAHLRKDVILATVSGVASTKPSLVEYFDKKQPSINVITTKSFQVNPNPGNREPVICEVESGSFGNSVGLRNPGMEVSYPPLKAIKDKGMRAYLNISVSASNVDDFVTLIKKFDDIASSIELNFSCPHASSGYGSSIGCDINIASEYVKEIRERYPDMQAALLIKLTPNVDNIGQIAKAVIDSGADGIVAINTVGPECHIHKESGLPILNNKLGGKGGKSGRWIKERALSAVKEIRGAIGDDPIIIGMGGLSDSYDVASMILSGADAVGVGSVFGKVKQQDWFNYLNELKSDTISLLQGKEITNSCTKYIENKNQMEYVKHTVIEAFEHTKDMLIIKLDGKLNYKAGEFAFLFLPGVGEKPFSIAHSEPLTFLIRKRGEFTSKLFDLKVGDTIYVRSLYGKPLEHKKSKNVLLLAGGSGVAVLPSLCKMVENDNSKIDILVGTTAQVVGIDNKKIFEEYFLNYGSYEVIPDDGVPGRVLSHLKDKIGDVDDTKVYIVGPEKFMVKACEILTSLGLKSDDIYLSMEKSTLCGIGMCGECVCGDRLTCQYGTFFSYSYILQNARDLLG